MSTYRDRAADQRIAEDVGFERTLMCRASGCPNRWTVDAGNGKCCSAHAWADQHAWPCITQEQIDAETVRALRNAAPPPPTPRVNVAAARAAIRENLPKIGRGRPSKQWALDLKAREQRGEHLTPAQREMWRAAVGAHAVLDGAVAGRFVPVAAITDALRVTGDIPQPDARQVPIEAYEDAP